jgi:hypothetical protein
MSGNAPQPPAQSSSAHWLLAKPIEMTSITPFYGKFVVKLSSDNYSVWVRLSETALRSIKLFKYCDGSLPLPTDPGEQTYWRQADMLVQGILISNMEPDVLSQIDPGLNTAEIWAEVKKLFTGQTTTNYTLTISLLINTKYGEGDETVLEHIMKMKQYKRDLIMMNRKLDDDIFTCLLHLSMPQDWNYVFAGLVDLYTSADVEN